MRKGSLVVFEAIDDSGVATSSPGIVVKGPYGSVISLGKKMGSHETKVVDVLFAGRLITKIPINSLLVVK
jgi:hypothetical protein